VSPASAPLASLHRRADYLIQMGSNAILINLNHRSKRLRFMPRSIVVGRIGGATGLLRLQPGWVNSLNYINALLFRSQPSVIRDGGESGQPTTLGWVK
jgi:hypothetical protein